MKIFDQQFSHAISAGSPYDYVEMPFKWERNFKEIKPSEFIFFTESEYEKSKSIISDKKILWILETPFMIMDFLIQDIIKNHQLFHTILTHDDRLIHLPNAKKFPIGGCWIINEFCEVYNKELLTVSTIISDKNWAPGHQIRHQIPQIRSELINKPKIEIFGSNFYPLKGNKSLAFQKYQFHICVENVKNDNYFTEKIIDCFATGTIPIYYGCIKISEYFNTKGIIEIDDVNELKFCLENLDQFKVDQDAIQENFELSKEYWLPEDRIFKIFQDN